MKPSQAFLKLFNVFLIFGVVTMLFSQPGWAVGRASAVEIVIRCYVDADATGSNNGVSWTDAYTNLQSTLGGSSCMEIWVAEGIYRPTKVTTARAVTFQLVTGVALYGGFAGTETTHWQRNPAANLTILSGDIDNNDSQKPIITNLTTVTGNTTNSYHVVTSATGATLDGFTITAGYADGFTVDGYNSGGGLYTLNNSPTLANLTFSGNYAKTDGGGLYNNNGSTTLENVTFSSNSAGEKGGGMSTWGSSPTLTDVTFNGNKVIGAGVGSGGGMFIYGNSPILTNVTFTGNSTDATGGGMYNLNSSPVLINVTFSGNSAVYGGGINDLNSSPALLNVTLKTNSASYRGGGMYHRDGNPTIINAIFWGNTAPSGGAQIYNYSGTPSLYDSVVQGGYPGGTHIIITDPMLGMLGNYGGFTQTIPVLEGSSAIDTGNDTFCPDTDQRGAPRPVGAHCDIGAFEYYPFRIFLPLVFR